MVHQITTKSEGYFAEKGEKILLGGGKNLMTRRELMMPLHFAG